jgi:hypothetical protein
VPSEQCAVTGNGTVGLPCPLTSVLLQVLAMWDRCALCKVCRFRYWHCGNAVPSEQCAVAGNGTVGMECPLNSVLLQVMALWEWSAL